MNRTTCRQRLLTPGLGLPSSALMVYLTLGDGKR